MKQSSEATNSEIFLWALYLLGGAEHKVDVEAVYLKAFELAPLKLGWRTRPDLPNFKKVAQALTQIELRTHVGFLSKLGHNFRQLTPAGISWIETNKSELQAKFSGSHEIAPSRVSNASRSERERLATTAWKLWKTGAPVPLSHVATALECSTFSSPDVWASRLSSLVALSRATANPEIQDFVTYIQEQLDGRGA